MPENKLTVGSSNNIRFRREALGSSIADLAQKIGITKEKLSRIEADPARVTLQDLYKLETALDKLEKAGQSPPPPKP